MCVYTYLYTYAYVYVYIHTHRYVYLCMHTCIHLSADLRFVEERTCLLGMVPVFCPAGHRAEQQVCDQMSRGSSERTLSLVIYLTQLPKFVSELLSCFI